MRFAFDFHDRRPLAGLVAAAALAALAGSALAPAAAQDDIETESITEQGTLDPFSAATRDLRTIFEAAEQLFGSAQQPDSVALFDRLITRLETDHAREPLPADLLEMLIASRSHRAEAHFNLGDSDKAGEDLERILQLQPGWRLDPDLVSPKLVQLAERLRREMVGELLVVVEPMDATLTLDGRPIAALGQPAAVLAGSRRLAIARPGYAGLEEEVEIRAGRTTTVEQTLERLSTVARVRVQPAGATVLVDGEPADVAERTPLEGAGAEEDLAIDGLSPGTHVIELRLAEHRPYRFAFEAHVIDDYRMPPVALDRMQGEIHLTNLPAGASVTFDGAATRSAGEGGDPASFALAPGDYLVEVRQPGVGGFRERVALGDQEIVEVAVRLRPTIAFLGVLGSDRLAATRLADRLAARLDLLTDWLWSDQSIDAPAVLDGAGLSAPELRRIAALANRRAAPDWSAIQQSFDRRFGASLYLLAVLGDDLYATSADLWLWSPAPWPAAPGVRTVSIQGGDEELERLMVAFDTPPAPAHLRLGARFIESDGLAVSAVIAGGAAAAAGLTPGDRVVAVDGQAVSTLRQLQDRLRPLAGSSAVLRIGGPAAPREVRLTIDSAPGVVTLSDAAVADQVVAARLALELLRADSPIPHWLLELNRAALFLRALDYEAAVPLLRTIEAPAGDGLSAAMVDYWLGTALLTLDPRTYADAARAALERALQQQGARLYHPDGPLLAPRARARLAELARRIG